MRLKHETSGTPAPRSKLRRSLLLEIRSQDVIPLCNRSRKRHVGVYASALRLPIYRRLNLTRDGVYAQLGILHDDFVID